MELLLAFLGGIALGAGGVAAYARHLRKPDVLPFKFKPQLKVYRPDD